MKKLISLVTLFQLFTVLVAAEGISSYCTPKSKNPNCWEPSIGSLPKPPFQCPALRYCSRVLKITAVGNGQYMCEVNGVVNCTTLVKHYGAKLLGAPVLVSYAQWDICARPGACGMKSCMLMPSYGAISLSQFCK